MTKVDHISEYQQFMNDTAIKLTDQEKLDIEYGITPLGRQHRQYLKENPDKPMSFDDWKYMVKHDIDDVVNGKRPHYPYGTIQSDPLYGSTKKDFDDATPKRIGIIGHVDHGKIFIVGFNISHFIPSKSSSKYKSILFITEAVPVI